MTELPRWSEDTGAPEELARLLRHARQDGPSGADVERLEGRLAQSPPPSARWSRAGYVLPLALLGAIGLGVVGRGRVAPSSLSTQAPLPEAPPPAGAPPGPALGEPALVEPALVEPALVEPALPEPAESDSASPRPPTAPEPHEPAPRALPTELELLRPARARLATEPSATLRLVERHRAWYPHGQLSQEREVLAIEALRRLGRSAEAQRRARDFVTQHPESAHKYRIERAADSESDP